MTKDIETIIVNTYKARPITVKNLSKILGYSEPTIIKVLSKYKIKRWSRVKLFSPYLKEDYFSNIDTEKKAYFLGIIITDGCVYKKNTRQNLVSITLQDKDKYIIEKFKKDICSNKVVTSDGRGCSELNILSNKMVSDLYKYGIVENKSLNTTFPNTLDKEFYPHLIRGIIDGDGSISFYARPHRKSHVRAIRLCQGNEKFLNDIVRFLHNEIGTSIINTYMEKDSLWSIAYRSKSDLFCLYHYLYDDATIYFTRKKELCDKIINEITN